MPSRDIREQGVFGGNGRLERALETHRRYEAERARRLREYREAYQRQFRPRRPQPDKSDKKPLRWWICKRMGVDPESDFEPRPFHRGKISPELIPSDIDEESDDAENDRVITRREMPPRSTSPVEPMLWVLDAETYEIIYDCDDLDCDHPFWSHDRYDDTWVSVGLIVRDDEFQSFLNGDDALLDQIDHCPSLDIPTLRKPSTGPLTGPPGQYRRSRFLDISCLAENLRTTKRMLEDEANNWKIDGIPMRWKLRLLKYQDEAEQVIKNAQYELDSRDGEYRLAEAEIGDISRVRFPYIKDQVRLNRARLTHILDNLADWTMEDQAKAEQEMTQGTSFDVGLKPEDPKRLADLMELLVLKDRSEGRMTGTRTTWDVDSADRKSVRDRAIALILDFEQNRDLLEKKTVTEVQQARDEEELSEALGSRLVLDTSLTEADLDPEFAAGMGTNRESGMNLRTQLYPLSKDENACAVGLLKYLEIPDISEFSLSNVYSKLESHPKRPLEITIPSRLRSKLGALLDPNQLDYNVEVKYLMVFRFISSHFIQPRFFVGYSLALDEYCRDSINRSKYADALTVILRGMTSTRRTGADLEGWLTETWAMKGQSRSVFFQKVLERFCPDFINPLLARAQDDLITCGFDFWTDCGVTNVIYRTIAMLLGYDWALVAYIASQDAVFIRRLNKQSLHEFHRARTFLENFSDHCQYRNLRMGPNSERFDSNMVNGGVWSRGTFSSVECDDPNIFYTMLGSHFAKQSVEEVVNSFTDLVKVVKYPIDLLRVIAQYPLYSLLIITLQNGDTWRRMDSKCYLPLSELKKRPECSCMFRYPSPISSNMKKFISGRATTETPRPGQERNRFVVRFTDVFDQVSIDRFHHSSKCGYCRCPWTTLQFRTAFALDHAWSGLVAEFLKFLASTTVQSKWFGSHDGVHSSPESTKYCWIAVNAFSCMREKNRTRLGSVVSFDLVNIDESDADDNAAVAEMILIFQISTSGQFLNSGDISLIDFPCLLLREMGWHLLIDLTTRITTGPRKNLSAGDVVLQFVRLVGEIYGPLLGCASANQREGYTDLYTFTLLRQCPHAKAMAHTIRRSCQFAPCHCLEITCDVNQLYCRLFSATYKFVRQYAQVAGIKIGMSKVLPHRYISRVIKDFMVTHTDADGIETAYSMRPGVNLYAQFGYLSPDDPKGLYDGRMCADFVLGDFGEGGDIYCDSVTLIRDFLTNEQLSQRLPARTQESK